MAEQLYRVIPLELNLRSAPVVEARTVLARLRQGQDGMRPHPGHGAAHGLAAGGGRAARHGHGRKAAYLDKATAPAIPIPPTVLPNVPEASLCSPYPVRRNQSSDGPRVYDLSEPNQPGRSCSTPAERAQQLGTNITYLGVNCSARYAAGLGKTYCNIYTHLAGAFPPWVWCTRKTLVTQTSGQAAHPAYGITVQELNTNSFNNWLEEFGPGFGWPRFVDLTEVQDAANAGQVYVVSGRRKDLNMSGHICAVTPETALHLAKRQKSRQWCCS